MKNTLIVYCTRDEARILDTHWTEFIHKENIQAEHVWVIRDILRRGKGTSGPGLVKAKVSFPEGLDLTDIAYHWLTEISHDIMADWLLDCGGVWALCKQRHWLGDIPGVAPERVRESFQRLVTEETALRLYFIWNGRRSQGGMWHQELGGALGRYYWLECPVFRPAHAEMIGLWHGTSVWGQEKQEWLMDLGLRSLGVPESEWPLIRELWASLRSAQSDMAALDVLHALGVDGIPHVE